MWTKHIPPMNEWFLTHYQHNDVETIVTKVAQTRLTPSTQLDLEALRTGLGLSESEFRAVLTDWLMSHSDYAGNNTDG